MSRGEHGLPVGGSRTALLETRATEVKRELATQSQLHANAVRRVQALEAENAALREQLEQEQVRLAGCMIAATGLPSNVARMKSSDYGWSPAFEAVAALRQRAEAAEKERDAAHESLRSLASWLSVGG